MLELTDAAGFRDEVTIEWVSRSMIDDVAFLEQLASQEEPWTVKELCTHLSPTHRGGRVLRCRGSLVACALHEVHKDKVVLTRILTLPSWRRRGAGRLLVDELAQRCGRRKADARRLEMLVPEEHLDVQLLLKACSFSATEVVHELYGDLYHMVFDPAPARTPSRPARKKRFSA